MSDTPVDIDTDHGDEIYKALSGIDDNAVIELCRATKDGPLYDCTMHKSTVLHLACYFKKWELAEKLFDSLSENLLDQLVERKNEWGDTVLHDVSTSNKGVTLAEKMLRKRPGLLEVRNKAGETPIFRATRYGKMDIFKFLDSKVHESNGNYYHFFQRDDGTTILHMAILTRNFDMALMIAKKYRDLHGLKAHNKWTALQILACSPSAFESGARFGILKKLLYKCVSIDERGDQDQVGLIDNALFQFKRRICKCCCILPIIQEIIKMKQSHKDALELSKILIEADFSWRNTYLPSAEATPAVMDIHVAVSVDTDTTSTSSRKTSRIVNKYGRVENHADIERAEKHEDMLVSDEDKGRIKNFKETLKYPQADYESHILESDEAPLLMAARKGCIEIVEETLNKHPQAVYYLNNNQENLLHVAIKTRNIKIFDYVEKIVPFLRGQLRALDRENNSILHMVGCSKKEHLDKKMKSPVLQLSEDLRLLQKLKEKCPNYLQYHRNNDMKTADELFAEKNEELRKEAKEWLRKTSEHSTVVIILIATVAFAAAYTVPGGPDEETGYPVLLKRPLFLVFTITDVLSLGFALTAVVVFLSIITSSYQLKDFRRSLPRQLFLGFTLLFLSVTMMMVAFAATIILMVNDKRRWTKIALYVVAFFPICIFMLSYIPIYAHLVEHIRDWVIGFRKFLPRLKEKNSLPCTTRPPTSSPSMS